MRAVEYNFLLLKNDDIKLFKFYYLFIFNYSKLFLSVALRRLR